MTREIVSYARFSTEAQIGDDQREELGDWHKLVAEYRDDASTNQGVQDRHGQLLAAKGKFDVLLCTDITRLTRQVTPEIITALRDAGVKVVTADGGELGFADLVAHTLMHHLAKTELQHRSERIKAGKRAARERRKDAADAAGAGSGSE